MSKNDDTQERLRRLAAKNPHNSIARTIKGRVGSEDKTPKGKK